MAIAIECLGIAPLGTSLAAADALADRRAAARRVGYRPLVADFFDDSDTRGFCAANRLIAGGLESGFSEESLVPALEALAELEAPCGLVYGAGFEDRAGLLEALGRRWAIFGNPPAAVRRVKDPIRLAELCIVLEIPHPKISSRVPRDFPPRNCARFSTEGNPVSSTS